MDKGQHCVYDLKYHIVLVVKYGKKVLKGHVAETCKSECVRLIEHMGGKVTSIETDEDHVHMLVSLTPKHSIQEVLNVVKGVSSRTLRRIHSEELKPCLWGDSFWSNSYFIASTGGAPLDVIKKYVEEQGRPKRKYTKRT